MRPLSNKSSNNSSFPPVDCKYDRVLSAHDLASNLKKIKNEIMKIKDSKYHGVILLFQIL